jgi:serine/threonine-protein kinase mTOR
MARELFAAGFVSCWAVLSAAMQNALVKSLEAALAAPTIPPEIVTTLLNLAEFMEHDEKALPLDTRSSCSPETATVLDKDCPHCSSGVTD